MPPPPTLAIRPLTPDRWDDLARLFGPNGAYSNCWCTFFRQTGAQFGAGCEERGAGNRTLLHRLTREGRVPGLLAYRGEQPIGWVSVAPRTEFGRMLRSPILGLSPDERQDASTWSIVCFFVPRAERRRGIATALLRGAVAHARQMGARTLEAYPVDTRGARHPGATLYVGTLDLFAGAGFREALRRLPSRPVVRLAL